MDQAQQLRNVIKGRNCVITGNARIHAFRPSWERTPGGNKHNNPSKDGTRRKILW